MFKSLILVFLLLNSSLALSKIELTIFVEQVPKYYTPLDEDIFIAGSFNNWNLNDENFKLKRLSHSTFSLNLFLDKSEHEYKFSRGSLNTIETNFDGSPLASNRKLLVNEQTNKQILNIKIENWNDMVGNHSASGNLLILTKTFPFPTLNTTKYILVYLPPDYYTTNKSYPVLYVNDGQASFDVFFNYFNADTGYDEMMEDFYFHSKQTSIMVGIPQLTMIERTEQLTPFPNNNFPSDSESPGGKGDLYLESIVSYLKPYIDKNFRTKPHRNYTGIIGYSLGGLISFYAGVKHQNTFSKIGAFSATYLWNDTIYSFAQNSPVLYADTKFYCIVGLKENGTYEGISYDMITTMNKMVGILRTVGYKKVFNRVYNDGEHEHWFWRRELPRAYRYFFLEEKSSSSMMTFNYCLFILSMLFNLKLFFSSSFFY